MMVVIVTVSASITANEMAMMTPEEAAEAQEEITEAEVKAKEVEANLIAREEAVNRASTEITDHQKDQEEAEGVGATISESREIITLADEVMATASETGFDIPLPLHVYYG